MRKSDKNQSKKKKKEQTSHRTRTGGSPHQKDHDALARVGFSDIKGVRGLLKTELPADIEAALDLSTLQRISDSYTDDNLKGTLSDKAFTCKSYAGETAIIAFICEHIELYPK